MEIKQLLAIITCLGVLGWTATSNAAGRPENAGPPENAGACSSNADERPKKPGKVLIAHCGCNTDGTDLVWKQIRVSTRAQGHLKHVPFSDINSQEVGCSALDMAGEPVEISHKRNVSDCVMPDEGNNIGAVGGLETCGEDIYSLLGQSCSLDGPQEIPESEPEP
jgi:hypothetical protein